MAITARLSAIRQITAEIQKVGLTPFDLCSWTGLLILTGRASDLDWTAEVHAQLEKAIRRKAEDLDAEAGTEFHRKILGDSI